MAWALILYAILAGGSVSMARALSLSLKLFTSGDLLSLLLPCPAGVREEEEDEDILLVFVYEENLEVWGSGG